MTRAAIETLTSRSFQGDDDFWRVRRLIIETYPITPTGFNWEMRRWDGWYAANTEVKSPDAISRLVRLWETHDGVLVGAVHPDGDCDCVLELHPDYRALEADMLAWGEANLAADKDGSRQITVSCFDYDETRQHLLAKRGYERLPYGSVLRRQRFGAQEFTRVPLAEGYTLRGDLPLDDAECQTMADLLNAAFGRTMHTAAEYAHFMTHSPSFRSDLNLIAVAPDGTFASYVGVSYEPTNRYAIFEPVCTHPDHQRKGLARALMLEGLCRLKSLGATDAYVGTGDGMDANYLYEATGFTEVYHDNGWRKVF